MSSQWRPVKMYDAVSVRPPSLPAFLDGLQLERVAAHDEALADELAVGLGEQLHQLDHEVERLGRDHERLVEHDTLVRLEQVQLLPVHVGVQLLDHLVGERRA